jgi:hypothetical protein
MFCDTIYLVINIDMNVSLRTVVLETHYTINWFIWDQRIAKFASQMYLTTSWTDLTINLSHDIIAVFPATVSVPLSLMLA